VRWSGFVVPLYSETYTFYTTTDDGVRLWVNNIQVINKYKIKLNIREIKETIYDEEGQEDFNKIIKLFSNVGSLTELNNILKTLNDVWNYFPHKSLGGLSPHEKLLEHLN